MLLSYGNISIIYILIFFFFFKSHKVQPAQLVRKETCRKDKAPLFPVAWIRFVLLQSGLG